MAKSQNYRIDETTIHREYGAARGRRGLPEDFDALSPANRTRALATASAEGSDFRPFTKAAGRLDSIRTIQGSLRTVAPGVRSYVRFSAVMGRNPSPPTEDSVRAWGRIFKPGWAFRNYIRQLKKAVRLMELDTKWDTSSARTSYSPATFIALRGHEGADFPIPPGRLSILPLLLKSAIGDTYDQKALPRWPFNRIRPPPQNDKSLLGIRKYENADLLVQKSPSGRIYAEDVAFAAHQSARSRMSARGPSFRCARSDPLYGAERGEAI